MDITSLSTDLAQARVQQDASVKLQKMVMDGAKDQGAGLVKMMNAATITDPLMGTQVNLLA